MSEIRQRLFCPICGTEILCTKPSDTLPECCGQEMSYEAPKEMTAAD